MVSKKTSEVLRGEIWEFDPDPVRGREQGKKIRPALIISSDQLNRSAAGLVIVIPLTTKNRGIPTHVAIKPKDGGVRKTSYAMCEQIRAISTERLVRRWGRLNNNGVLTEISEWLSDLLELHF